MLTTHQNIIPSPDDDSGIMSTGIPEIIPATSEVATNVFVVDIDPVTADYWLGLNITNRPLSTKWKRELARRLKNGEWKLNGETIVFYKNRLVQGQHRLAVVKETGISIRSYVVVDGIDEDAFPTFDNTKPRGGADVLSLAGYSNASVLASALKIVDTYFTGRVGPSIPGYSNWEIDALAQRYSGLVVSVSLKNRSKLLAPSLFCACHYLFSLKDENLADKFMDDLVRGANLEVGSGIYLLREKLMTNTMSKAKLPWHILFAYTIKAWNLDRKQEKLSKLVFAYDGPRSEPFPIVQ